MAVLVAGAGTAGVLVLAVPGVASAALPAGCAQSGSTVTCTYGVTGGVQTFSVPAGVTAVSVTLSGGGGGAGAAHDLGGGAGGAGGAGATVTGTVTVPSGQDSLSVFVGGKGGDGTYALRDAQGGAGGFGYGTGGIGGIRGDGNNAMGGGGGGGSALVAGTTPLAVAAGGGGGGGGGRLTTDLGGTGGASGADGVAGNSMVPGGSTGGIAGGQAGPDGGADARILNGGGAGGGGGGGLLGGTSGDSEGSEPGGGGGGGSDLVPSGGSKTDGANSGAGQVTISYTISAAEQLVALRQAVQGVGSGTSLADKVATAQSQLAAGDTAGSCATLADFLNLVRAQTGKKIPADTAAQLTADATRIRGVLGC